MKIIGCAGTEAFTLGFQLAGIRKVVNIYDKSEAFDKIWELKDDKGIGIVIVDEKVMEMLDDDDRNDIEESIQPVFVTVSEKSSAENLRKLIIKSIGVDLWKGD